MIIHSFFLYLNFFKMVQALVCTQDWLRAKGSIEIDVEENLRDLEELEKGNDTFSYYMNYFTTSIRYIITSKKNTLFYF